MQKFVQDLEALVNINSYTLNPQGVRAVGDLLRPRLERLGFTVEWVSNIDPARGDHLFAKKNGKNKRILLLGHLDTVYPPESSFQKYESRAGKACGPGTYDMKGGVLVMLYALESLADQGLLDDAAITIALMGDEENTAQPFDVARESLRKAAAECRYALGFEFARAANVAVIGRRGITRWDLEIETTGGHSSRVGSAEFGQGASYILAEILHQFSQLMKTFPGLTINPGLMSAGSEMQVSANKTELHTAGRRNIIATRGFAHGDLRYLSVKQFEQVMKEMQEIIDAHRTHDVNIVFEVIDGMPALETTAGNENLLAKFSEISVKWGGPPVHAVDPMVAGAADMNMIGNSKIDSIDGLGPVGGGAHTHEEHIDVAQLPFVILRVEHLIAQLLGS